MDETQTEQTPIDETPTEVVTDTKIEDVNMSDIPQTNIKCYNLAQGSLSYKAPIAYYSIVVDKNTMDEVLQKFEGQKFILIPTK